MKIGILTSPNQWFENYVKKLSCALNGAPIYIDHSLMDEQFDVLFILSYHRLIDDDVLKKNKHNIVIHESDLPKGKGWAPLFWQILEGKNEIIFTMFEASKGIDNGDFYMKRKLLLSGYELNGELRDKQAQLSIQMCLDFIKNYPHYLPPQKQSGEESLYPKRTADDSELDINKTIKEQFDLLRTVNNESYPAFFLIDGNKYILKIEQAN